MGKRGNKNKNTNIKKKSSSHTENTKPEPHTSLQKSVKSDPKKSNSSEAEIKLRQLMKGQTSTFRARLLYSKGEYSTEDSLSLDVKSLSIVQIFPLMANELIQEILSLVQTHSKRLSEFLLESYRCVQSVCFLFEKIFNTQSFTNVSKLNYFCKILRPACEVDKSLSKISELRGLYRELQALSKDFKDHSMLPLENLVQMINGTASVKIFSRVYGEVSTDGSSSPNRKVDSEVEEFRTRLESCELLSMRKKPQVTQEWINYLRSQLSSNFREI